MIQWKDEYSLGIANIDEEYQHIFKLAHRCYKHLLSESYNDKSSNIAAILAELKMYAVEHFKSEEEYMKSIDYDRLSAQIADHNQFVEMINVFECTKMNEKQDLVRILNFLVHWIDNHVLEEDKLIAKVNS